jgi:hypothetical protein
MMAGVDLDKALWAVFRGKRGYKYPQASSEELAKGLRRLGVRCHMTSRFGPEERRGRVILGFNWKKVVPGEGHYVVWCPVGQRFRDPGYERPWALRNDIYVQGFRECRSDYLAVVAPNPPTKPIRFSIPRNRCNEGKWAFW